jgi:predicted Fe-Mo cluster-binding NifX family protein
MKVGMTVWDGRISPVFDAARQMLVFDVQKGHVVSSHEEALPDDQPVRKIESLRSGGVEVLVCGAVSADVSRMISAAGIRVIPYVAGSLGDVLRAFLTGNLPNPALQMPGCCGGQRRFRGGRG